MRKAEPLAGLGGLALIASLFLDWYTATPVVPDRLAEQGFQAVQIFYVRDGGADNAWGYFAVLDIVLALFAALALAVPLSTLLTKGPAKSIGTAVLASAFGWIAIVLVAYRLLVPPYGDLDGLSITTEYGGLVALGASIVAWVGSWLSMRDESTPGAPPPSVPRHAAP